MEVQIDPLQSKIDKFRLTSGDNQIISRLKPSNSTPSSQNPAIRSPLGQQSIEWLRWSQYFAALAMSQKAMYQYFWSFLHSYPEIFPKTKKIIQSTIFFVALSSRIFLEIPKNGLECSFGAVSGASCPKILQLYSLLGWKPALWPPPLVGYRKVNTC